MERKDRTVPAIVSALMVVVLLLAGCSSSSDSGSGGEEQQQADDAASTDADEGTPEDGGQLVYGIEAEPDGLDPLSSQWAIQGAAIASSMMEPLTTFDADGTVQPYLAESFEPSELASKWTIKVRPGITFHDGTALDAEVVKQNLEAQQTGIGGILLQLIESITVEDPMTVVIKMTQPWASFPGAMTSSGGVQIAPSTLGTPEAVDHPIGTGPFEFVSWDRDNSVEVKKYDGYWQEGKPHLDAISFRIIPDPASRASSLRAGDLDMITTDQVSTLDTFATDPDFRTIVDRSGDAVYITMNQAQPPFDNTNAREALTLATNSAAIAETLGKDVLEPTDQPFAEDSAYHADDAQYKQYDLDGAKAAVEAYTAETGQPLTFEFLVFNTSTNAEAAQLLQAQWKEAGIEANIDVVEQAAAISDIIVGNFEAYLATNFGYPEPDLNYIFWHSDFTHPIGELSLNFPHMQRPDLDEKLVEGRANLIPSERQAAYQEAARIINDDDAYIWLYRYVYIMIANKRVKGLNGAEEIGISNYAMKTWYPDIWISQS